MTTTHPGTTSMVESSSPGVLENNNDSRVDGGRLPDSNGEDDSLGVDGLRWSENNRRAPTLNPPMPYKSVNTDRNTNLVNNRLFDNFICTRPDSQIGGEDDVKCAVRKKKLEASNKEQVRSQIMTS